MVRQLRLAGRHVGAAGAGAYIIAFSGLVAAYAGVRYAGTKTGTVLAILAVTGPLLLSLVLFAPFVFPFGLYALLTPFDSILSLSAAGTATKLLGALSAGALLLFMVRTKRFADPDRSVAVWLLYYLWLTASLFWASDSKMTSDLLPTALLLFALYVIVSMVRVDEGGLQTVSAFVIAGGIAASGYLLYLYHSGVAIHASRLWLQTDTVNWNPDHLAAALLLPISLAVMMSVFGRSLFVRLCGLASLGIMLPTLVLTGARGPELGLLTLLIYLLVREPERKRLARLIGTIFALGLGLALNNLSTRWADALSSGGAGRTDIWHVGIVAFKHNWLFGAGFNNFPVAYNRAMMEIFQPLYIGWNRAPHNILLGNAVELGIVGLILLLTGWYYQFRALRSIGLQDPRFRMRLALEASLIALFVSGLFADVMLTKYLWLAFMLVSLTRNAVPVLAPAIAQVRASVVGAHA